MTDPWLNQAYLDPHQGFLRSGDPFEGMSTLPHFMMWDIMFQAPSILKGEEYKLMGLGPRVLPEGIFKKGVHRFKPRDITRKRFWKTWGGRVDIGAKAPQWMKGEAVGKFLKGGGGRALGIAGSALKGFNVLFAAQLASMAGEAVGSGMEALAEYGGERIALEQYGLQNMSPEFTDSGSAATMRQQSVMAIRQSQYSLATHFGREAMAVHR